MVWTRGGEETGLDLPLSVVLKKVHVMKYFVSNHLPQNCSRFWNSEIVVAPTDTLSMIYCSIGIWFKIVIGGVQTNSPSEAHHFVSLYHKFLMTQRDVFFL